MPRVRWHDPPKPRPMPRASYRLPGRKVPRELEHWTGFSVIALADAAQQHYSRVLRKLNMTITDFIVLAVIVRQDGICATDIAERAGLSRQRISTVLCEFDRSAWIERDVKVGDFRYKGVWLSNLGRDAWEEACAAIHRADRLLHLDMPESRRVALRKLLLGLVPGSASEVRMARRGW
jgi:DNA-binding MarR family transcriptional regulator